MKRSVKISLIVATAMIALGLIFFAILMTANGWDFSKLSTVNYETNTYEIIDGMENISSISITSDTADICFMPSSDEKIRIVCHERAVSPYTVSVSDGTLFINSSSVRRWLELIKIDFDSPSITVYIPSGFCPSLSISEHTGNVIIGDHLYFKSIDIHTSTGDIELRSITVDELELSVSTGNIKLTTVDCEGDISISVSTGKSFLENTVCDNLITAGDTGDISLKNVIASGKFDIKRTTGDVSFELADAAEIYVTTSTGNVTGSFISEKSFITSTSTGRVRVPQSSGGRCEIKTSTGDITIEIK